MAEERTEAGDRVSSRGWWRILLGLALGACLLVWSFRDVAVGQWFDAVSRARFWLLLLAAVPALSVPLLKSVKWRLILAPLADVKLGTTFASVLVGEAAKCVLPFRTDDLVKGHALARRVGLPWPAVVGTIVVERTIDLAVLLGFAVLAALTAPVPEVLQGATHVACVLFGALSLGVVGFSRWPDQFAQVLTGLTQRLFPPLSGHVERAVESLHSGVDCVPSWGRLGAVLAVAACEWLAAMASVCLSLLAFGLSPSVARCLTLSLVEYLSFAIPASPGAVGLFEAIAKGVLVAMFDVDGAVALGYAVAYHLVIMVPAVIPGAIMMLRLDSVHEIGGRKPEAEEGLPAQQNGEVDTPA